MQSEPVSVPLPHRPAVFLMPLFFGHVSDITVAATQHKVIVNNVSQTHKTNETRPASQLFGFKQFPYRLGTAIKQ